MANTREVSVGAPDDLGLRKVTIDGKTVGKAWSPWELQRFLDRAGVERGHDIRWFGGDSTVWPDRGGWRRRTIGFLVFIGLLATVCPLFRIGISDSGNALTYGGRIAGFTILVASLVEACAAVACIDYWGKRRWRYSGVVVLAGVVIALLCGIALLLLQIGERFTGYTLLGIALTVGSSLALVELVKSRAWKGLHNPGRIAIGAVISTVLAGANLAYSQIYVPYVKTPLVESGAEFRESNLDKAGGPMYVTVHLYVKNAGEVPVYVLDSKYWIHGVPASSRPETKPAKGTSVKDKPAKDELIYDGAFVVPVGRVLNPGEEVAQDSVVEVDDPASRPYEAIRAQTEVYVIRKDRMKVPPDYERSGVAEKDLAEVARKEKVTLPPHTKYMYRSNVSNSSEILNVTRGPQRITVFRVASSQWPRVVVDVSPPGARIDLKPNLPLANERAIDRYGLSVVRGSTAQMPYQELMEKARAVQKQAEPPK
ncbi:hypothetical protein ACFCV9_19060 [Streptomyces sp. NPDC056367]|uniref:hypothetical protein n=1 Tax=unclassified Streptomyces TaxID=2593676 RepID=UPI0035DB8462